MKSSRKREPVPSVRLQLASIMAMGSAPHCYNAKDEKRTVETAWRMSGMLMKKDKRTKR